MAKAPKHDPVPAVSAAAAKAAVEQPVSEGFDRVIATGKGYYRWLIEPGEMFDVPKGMTGTWFKLLDADSADEI